MPIVKWLIPIISKLADNWPILAVVCWQEVPTVEWMKLQREMLLTGVMPTQMYVCSRLVYWYCPHSTQSRVGVMVSCVCLSHHSTTAVVCSGFAAEHHVGRRYWSTAANAGHPAAMAPQHSNQQLMWAVSCCQPSSRGWIQTCFVHFHQYIALFWSSIGRRWAHTVRVVCVCDRKKESHRRSPIATGSV